jgi:protein TonB
MSYAQTPVRSSAQSSQVGASDETPPVPNQPGLKHPQPIYLPKPEYTQEAINAKFSGHVEVYLWVEVDGTTSHIRVVKSVGMGLDEKAIESVQKSRFKPATLNGKPVKFAMYIDVDFSRP